MLQGAEAVALEWVTANRLEHVRGQVAVAAGVTEDEVLDMKYTPLIIKAMQADVQREAEGEVVWSKAVSGAVGKATAQMWKRWVTTLTRVAEAGMGGK